MQGRADYPLSTLGVRQAQQDSDLFDRATGAESAEALRWRVCGVLSEITTRHHDDGVVLVVSHGGTLNACLAELLGLSIRGLGRFRFDNTGLSVVDVGRRPARLGRHNDTHHLRRLGGR